MVDGDLRVATVGRVYPRQGSQHGAVFFTWSQTLRGVGRVGFAAGVHGGDDTRAGEVDQTEGAGHCVVRLHHCGGCDRLRAGAAIHGARLQRGHRGQGIDVERGRARAGHAQRHQTGGEVARLPTGFVNVVADVGTTVVVADLGDEHAGVGADVETAVAAITELGAAEQGAAIGLIEVYREAVAGNQWASNDRHIDSVVHHWRHWDDRCGRGGAATTAARSGQQQTATENTEHFDAAEAVWEHGSSVMRGIWDVGDFATWQTDQHLLRSALRQRQQGIPAAVRVGQRHAVAERGDGCLVAIDLVVSRVTAGQCDLTGRRLAHGVVVLQGEGNAVGVAELQVVALSAGDHVVEQLFLACLALDHAVVFTSPRLDDFGLTRFEGHGRLAVVQRECVSLLRLC